MRRYMDFLTPIGLAVMVAAYGVHTRGRLPGQLEYYLIAGGVLILIHLVLRSSDIVAAVGKRQLQHGGNALVLTLTVLGILGFVNFFAAKYKKSWDLTKENRFSLAEQTKKVVGGLKEDITITAFYDAFPGPKEAADRLAAYQALSPKVKYQIVDPLAKPEVTIKYNARGPYPMLFVEQGARQEKLNGDSEQELTNAIIRLSREKRKACFAYGYGERDSEGHDRPGYAQAKDMLGKNGFDVEKVALVQKPEIPDSCSVFLVTGPVRDYDTSLADALRAYVKKGGKLLLMIDFNPKVSYPNLIALAKEWNIEVANDIVLELAPIGQLSGVGGGPEAPAVVQYPYHEITRELQQGFVTVFPLTRSVKSGTGSVEGVMSQNLAETTPNSWGETNYENPPAARDDKDNAGPLSLAAVATIKGPEPPAPAEGQEKKEAPEGRVVVFGDADWASNFHIARGFNQDLFLNTMAWLVKDSDAISIRAKDPDSHKLVMDSFQYMVVTASAVGVLPLSFLVAGGIAWWRRRG